MDTFLIGATVSVCLVILFGLGFAVGATTTKEDCKMLGRIEYQKKIYECRIITNV